VERVLGGGEIGLWDCRPPCAVCGDLQHFMANWPGTPARPLLSHPLDSHREPLAPQAWIAG